MKDRLSDGDNDKEMKGIVKVAIKRRKMIAIKKRRREGSNEGVEERIRQWGKE